MNTPKRPAVNRINTVIDCGDAQIMAEFYSRLLGWELTLPAANGWAARHIAGGSRICISGDRGV